MDYTCPMHPEIKREKPGRCPLCQMRLVRRDSLPEQTNGSEAAANSYYPLLLIITLILLVTTTLSFRDSQLGLFSLPQFISYFMTGFFLTFSGFKLLDLPGFAQGYATYDLLAQKWFGYGYLYPFIELFFGLGMILFPTSQELLIAEVMIMLFSGLGVARKLLKHEKFRCACLGTFLKVPLTKVTLIEDFGMAILAVILLILR